MNDNFDVSERLTPFEMATRLMFNTSPLPLSALTTSMEVKLLTLRITQDEVKCFKDTGYLQPKIAAKVCVLAGVSPLNIWNSRTIDWDSKTVIAFTEAVSSELCRYLLNTVSHCLADPTGGQQLSLYVPAFRHAAEAGTTFLSYPSFREDYLKRIEGSKQPLQYIVGNTQQVSPLFQEYLEKALLMVGDIVNTVRDCYPDTVAAVRITAVLINCLDCMPLKQLLTTQFGLQDIIVVHRPEYNGTSILARCNGAFGDIELASVYLTE